MNWKFFISETNNYSPAWRKFVYNKTTGEKSAESSQNEIWHGLCKLHI